MPPNLAAGGLFHPGKKQLHVNSNILVIKCVCVACNMTSCQGSMKRLILAWYCAAPRKEISSGFRH